MSFIAITYGYNQYSIFNTNVSTLPLIDNIISICLDEMTNLLNGRLTNLNKELEVYSLDEDNFKKSIKKLETDKIKEEEKLAEAAKINEVALNKEKETNKKPAGGGNKPNTNNPKNPPGNNNLKNQPVSESNSLLNSILEEMKNLDAKLNYILNNKDKYLNKKKFLVEYLEKFKSFDKSTLKIDLVDVNGEKINIVTRGDVYASTYLQDRQVYELNRIFQSNIYLF